MEIHKLQEITFSGEDTIKTVTLSDADKLVMLTSSGNVVSYKFNDPSGIYLFDVKDFFSYEDGGFDINAKSTLFTLDEITVIVNDHKNHGYVHYSLQGYKIHLWRKHDGSDLCSYPIALYKDENGIPHLIYGVDWNHLQIMNLDTRQILTAAKSLIEVNAEESHIEFYKDFKEENKLPWPRPFDYFFGKLFTSPNKKRFLSAGWVWGSKDAYMIFDIHHFITDNRIKIIETSFWEHENRSVCWVDDETIAITYQSYIDEEENSNKNDPFEIHFYKIVDDVTELVNKIQVSEIDILHAQMHYNRKLNALIIFSDKIGLIVISLQGKILLHDFNMKIDSYSIETGLLIKSDDKTVLVYEISN